MSDFKHELTEAARAKLLATFAGAYTAHRFTPQAQGAWPKECDAPLGYDERDAKV